MHRRTTTHPRRMTSTISACSRRPIGSDSRTSSEPGSTSWTTLELTINADGTSTGKLIEFKSWYREEDEQ